MKILAARYLTQRWNHPCSNCHLWFFYLLLASVGFYALAAPSPNPISNPVAKQVTEDESTTASKAAASPPQTQKLNGADKLWGLDVADSVFNDAYGYDYTGEGVNIYIIDSGVETRHPGLLDSNGKSRARIMWVAPEVEKSQNQLGQTKNEDCSGHGSHVVGIAAGSSVGIAKRANIHVLRVLGCSQEVDSTTVIAALEYLAKNIESPAVISMSLGLAAEGTSNIRESSALANMVTRFTVELGIPFILSAGNSGSPDCSILTNSTKDALVVGAVDSGLRVADFSNYGGCVNFYGPGVNIQARTNFRIR